MEAATAWLMAIHIASLAVWSAGLLYLPGLLAAHPRTDGRDSFLRLRWMSRLTYLGIASPAAILAVISGSLLIVALGSHGGWLVLKLAAVALMTTFHVFCGYLVAEMRERPVRHSAAALASLSMIPALLVPATLYLVLAKPL